MHQFLHVIGHILDFFWDKKLHQWEITFWYYITLTELCGEALYCIFHLSPSLNKHNIVSLGEKRGRIQSMLILKGFSEKELGTQCQVLSLHPLWSLEEAVVLCFLLFNIYDSSCAMIPFSSMLTHWINAIKHDKCKITLRLLLIFHVFGF